MKIKALLSILILSAISLSGTSKDLSLPAPKFGNSTTLEEALQQRRTERNFDTEKELNAQQLSNLLWAAWGYNRKDKRTAPTALNKQDITLYVVLTNGIYRYDARNNKLILIKSGDHRAATGKQSFVATAPVNLVFVSDTKLLDNAVMSAVGCGAISQNIYLYCASAGLATVVRGAFDADILHKTLELDASKKVMLTQTIGFPAK